MKGITGAPETDRPGQVWGDLEDTRPVAQEGQNLGGSAPSHANIHSFINSPNSYPVPSTRQSVPGPANTARNKSDKNPCFHGVYSLIRRQKNKIKKIKYHVLDDKGFWGK